MATILLRVAVSVGFSLLARALTPTRPVEGQRLDNLNVTTSTEGAPVPRIYGQYRLAGNVIWATDFREVKTTSGGGKGSGGGVRTTDYTYYASFAVAICEGELASLDTVYMDGDLIADIFDGEEVTYRFYPGSETQDVDSLIESKMGAGNTPAYRGTAYVVFDDLPLEKFGNRLPQLSFVVTRPVGGVDATPALIKAVNIIPATGEFAYATEIIRNFSTVNGTVVEDIPINANARADTADFTVSLDTLETAASNLEAASLVVSWFGTDLRAGDCTVRPGVENLTATTAPKSWVVDGVARADAYLVSQSGGAPVFGGTPADFAVVQAIQDIKTRGKRVTFYPFVLMDIAAGNTLPDPYSDNAATVGQPVYPWRGRITCSPAAGFVGTVDKTAAAAVQVDAFFGTATAGDFAVAGETVSWTGGADWGYRRMILHYAHLCAAAGGVDSFLIGSELRGLTQVRSGAASYPTVAQLKTLAADVSAILGSGTQVGYAADWSEYFGHQPADGSGDVFFHLDPLWSDANIDFVGIDNYMPLSDWRDGAAHLDRQAGWLSIYDTAYLQSNVEGGEGFDWFYASAVDRDAQTRSTITDGAYGKPWVFRYKDIRAWWSSQHFDRPGGVEDAGATGWVPQAKPIRFTEAGCPAVDKGTNQPNVFSDPKSSESAMPYYSRGARDDTIQRRYIEALVTHWTANNPTSTVYSGPMLDLGELAFWAWDARPYPTWPTHSDIWGDTANYATGHWLNGRLAAVGLGDVVRDLCLRAGVASDLIDAAELGVADVRGYAISGLESARASIETLALVYGFDGVETGGQIVFRPRGQASVATIGADDLVAADEPRAEDFELIRAQETELPQVLRWATILPDGDNRSVTAEARRIVAGSARVESQSLPLLMGGAELHERVHRALFAAWVGRESASFRLPPSRLALDPADVILFDHDGRFAEFRLTDVTDGELREIEAQATDGVLYGSRAQALPDRVIVRPGAKTYATPGPILLNIPQLSAGAADHQAYIAVDANPWPTSIAVYRSPTTDGWALQDEVSSRAVIGTTAFDFYEGPLWRFDLTNSLTVDVWSGQLTSVTDDALFAGANTLAVGVSGSWEIVQFGAAELVSAGRYRLTRLLRGQRGTEPLMQAMLAAGAAVVLLDAAVQALPGTLNDVDTAYNWRVGAAALPVSDTRFAQLAFTPAGTGLRTFAPVHVNQPWRQGYSAGDLTIAWLRRSRDTSADSWDLGEPPLAEDGEAYEVDVMDGAAVKRTLTAAATSASYTAAQQTADWGAPLAPGASLDVIIYQISATRGRGLGLRHTIYL